MAPLSVPGIIEVDVDELRAHLVEETSEALALADELAFAVETGEPVAACQRAAANYRQARNRMRTLRNLIRIEDGNR
jgi:hypothetical protein